MPDLIDAMQAVLAEFSAGAAQQPLRTVLQVGEAQVVFRRHARLRPDAGRDGHEARHGLREQSRRAGLPSHLATIVLLDPSTGALRAIVDGRYITEARTGGGLGGLGAAARAPGRRRPRADWIRRPGAQPPRGPRATFGRCARSASGARTRPEGNRSSTRAKTAASGTASSRPTSARDAVDGADLVALVSSAREPVVQAEWISAGAHLCAVGACRPDQREMDTALVRAARVFVDSRTGRFAEAGDVLIPIAEGAITRDHIAGELGEARRRTCPGPIARRTRSRSSSRLGWPSKMWRPRISRSSGRWSEESER